MEKRLKHWEKIHLLNVTQKEGELHSAVGFVGVFMPAYD